MHSPIDLMSSQEYYSLFSVCGATLVALTVGLAAAFAFKKKCLVYAGGIWLFWACGPLHTISFVATLATLDSNQWCTHCRGRACGMCLEAFVPAPVLVALPYTVLRMVWAWVLGGIGALLRTGAMLWARQIGMVCAAWPVIQAWVLFFWVWSILLLRWTLLVGGSVLLVGLVAFLFYFHFRSALCWCAEVMTDVCTRAYCAYEAVIREIAWTAQKDAYYDMIVGILKREIRQHKLEKQALEAKIDVLTDEIKQQTAELNELKGRCGLNVLVDYIEKAVQISGEDLNTVLVNLLTDKLLKGDDLTILHNLANMFLDNRRQMRTRSQTGGNVKKTLRKELLLIFHQDKSHGASKEQNLVFSALTKFLTQMRTD